MKFDQRQSDIRISDRKNRYNSSVYGNCEIVGGTVKDYSRGRFERLAEGYCVIRPDQIIRVFETSKLPSDVNQFHRARRRAELYAQLWTHHNELYTDEDDVIPISLAVEGKPAIAAYLFAMEEQDITAISTQLSVSTDTVWKYLRRFRDDDFD